MSERVALVRCDEYDLATIEVAVHRACALIGGIERFVQPGQRVLLKPNMVRGVAPERAVSTHPTIVAAAAKLVHGVGAHPVIVESPGGPWNPALLRHAYRRTEIEWAAEVGHAELNYDCEGVQVALPDGQLLHRLDIAKAFLDADVVINLAKLKTHNLTGLTCAVKNLFGLVPGALKIGYHARLQDREQFCGGLLDLLTYVRPALSIVDAVVAMEGEGPSGGDPRHVGAIAAGVDALAVDTVCAELVGFRPREVVTTRVAVARGMTSGELADVDVVGDALDDLRVSDFRRSIESTVDPGLVPRILRGLLPKRASVEGERASFLRLPLSLATNGWVWRQLVAYPYAGDRCTGCGFCARHCPVEAIQVIDKRAVMDRGTCIRCYCCHELCPETAVELRKPLLGRLAGGN